MPWWSWWWSREEEEEGPHGRGGGGEGGEEEEDGDKEGELQPLVSTPLLPLPPKSSSHGLSHSAEKMVRTNTTDSLFTTIGEFARKWGDQE